MGSGPTTTSAPQLPPLATQLNRQSLQTALNLFPQAAKEVGSLLVPAPQGVAPLTQPQMFNIGQLENIAGGGSPQEAQTQGLYNIGEGLVGTGSGILNNANQGLTGAGNLLGGAVPYVGRSQNQIDQLTGGPIGSSPLTTAGMQAWQDTVAPTIASSLAASSGGRGGALPAAMSQAETQAAVPLISQEIGNREAAVGQEGNLASIMSGLAGTAGGLVGTAGGLAGTAGGLAGTSGGLGGAEAALGQQRSGDIGTAMTAADQIRQNQQEALASQFQAQQQVQQFIANTALGPYTQLTPLAVGQQSITSPGKF